MQAHEARALLEWYIDAGVDEAVCDVPANRTLSLPSLATSKTYQQNTDSSAIPQGDVPQTGGIRSRAAPPPMAAVRAASAPMMAPTAAIAEARKLADAADSLDALKQAVLGFDGCQLKRTATQMVFADGNPQSQLMIIGEAPGAEEDRQGIPFCGASGELLDKMFAAIGYTRENCYISNTLFWRPPGNREPSPDEIAICMPFVEKHIALVKPKALAFMGGVAAKSLLNTPTGITRLRGKSHVYTNSYLEGVEIPVEVIFHPSYLLRQPSHKKLAWEDLQRLKATLEA